MNGLYSYALVSTIYNEKGDYIDCFLPFVLSVIDSKISNTENELQGRIKSRYNFEIPFHSLRAILTRGSRKDYLTARNNRYFLTEKGVQFNQTIEYNQTRREIGNFLEKLTEFIKQTGGSTQEIEGAFEQYVVSNLKSLFYFTDIVAYDIETHIKGQNVVFPYITGFITQIEKANPELFKVFQNIIFGKIILIAIHGSADISELQQNFKKTTLFLDTNVIFDILGFQGDEAARVTDEFIQLTQKSKKFDFYVFDFTIDEIIRVVGCYPSQFSKYLSDVRVDSIYYHLKVKGWKNSDVNHFIQNVEQKLSEKNIQIFHTEKFVQPVDFDDKKNKLAQYKPERSFTSYKHDLRAIIEIEKFRSNRVTRFERARCFFLSQDAKLARFDYSEFEHKHYQSVPEVILEQALTNLLWLKTPKEIPLNALISFHKKYAVVDENVWRTFYDKILHAKESDMEFYNDTTTLLCHNQLQSTLANLDADATGEDIESTVKAEANVVRQREEKEKGILLTKQKREIEEQFSAHLERTKSENIRKLSEIYSRKLETLIQYRDQAENEALTWSGRVWFLLRVFLTLLLFKLCIALKPFVCSQWQRIEPIVWIACLVISIIGSIWGLNAIDLVTHLKTKLDNYLKRRKLKDINFEKLLQGLDVNKDDLKLLKEE